MKACTSEVWSGTYDWTERLVSRLTRNKTQTDFYLYSKRGSLVPSKKPEQHVLRRLVYTLAGGAGVIACGLAKWEARGLQKELGMVQKDV